MPVLPLVGSTMIMPGLSRPPSIASCTIALPMRSLTELNGLYPSCLSTTFPGKPLPILPKAISGVLPAVSVMLW